MPTVHLTAGPVQPAASRWAAFDDDWGPGSSAPLAALAASLDAAAVPNPYADTPFELDFFAGDPSDQLDPPSDLDQLAVTLGLFTNLAGYCELWAGQIELDGTDGARGLGRELRKLADRARAVGAETFDDLDAREELLADDAQARAYDRGYDQGVASTNGLYPENPLW